MQGLTRGTCAGAGGQHHALYTTPLFSYDAPGSEPSLHTCSLPALHQLDPQRFMAAGQPSEVQAGLIHTVKRHGGISMTHNGRNGERLFGGARDGHCA